MSKSKSKIGKLGACLSVAIVSLSLGVLQLAHAAEDGKSSLTAKIVDPANRQKVLFNYKHESEPKGDVRVVTNTFTDAEGKVAAIETAEFAKAGTQEKLRLYKMDQKQLNAVGVVEVKDGKAHFSYTKDGSTKTSEEKAGNDFIAGPSLVQHLQQHWDKILKGETVKTRFAVLDRRETVGFQFFKEKDAELNGQKVVVIKMKPSSFVIAALVDPLHFYLTPDGKKVVQIEGRVQVKKNEGGKWKDLDAVTIYEN